MNQEEGYYQAWLEATAKAEALEEAGEDQEALDVRGWARHLYREYKQRRDQREAVEA